MKRIATLVAGIAAVLAVVLSTASSASAANAVSADEFWHNLSNYTQTSFEDSLCNCSLIQSSYLDSSHDSKVVVYNAGVGYTHNVDTIVIRYDLTGGHWIPHNFPNNGGKQQHWADGSQHYYPVACTGAPC